MLPAIRFLVGWNPLLTKPGSTPGTVLKSENSSSGDCLTTRFQGSWRPLLTKPGLTPGTVFKKPGPTLGTALRRPSTSRLVPSSSSIPTLLPIMVSTNSAHPSSSDQELKLQHDYHARLAQINRDHSKAILEFHQGNHPPPNLQTLSLPTGLIPHLIPDSAAPTLLASTERSALNRALGSTVSTNTLLPVVLPHRTLANHLPASGSGMLTTLPLSQELPGLTSREGGRGVAASITQPSVIKKIL